MLTGDTVAANKNYLDGVIRMKLVFLLLAIIGLFSMVFLRLLDWHADHAEWDRLTALQPANPARFHPALVADLPEPAQRFFKFAIKSGTPLLPVAEIDMRGQFSLGSREKPNYRTMHACQILAAPHGFVWRLRLKGSMPVSGSDSGSWTRFRIFGLIPVARMGGDSDHMRSAFGRYVAEAVFWTPAAFLPNPGLKWEAIDDDIARVTVTYGELSQAVNVKVDAKGQLAEVSFLRWSNANPDKKHRLQPFGGSLSDFRMVQGYCLPFRVEAGNMFGTDEYFAFFKAEVTAISFPVAK